MAQEEFLDEPMSDIIKQWRYYFSILNPSKNDVIIDVGCGSGDTERLLLREYPTISKIIGVDNNEERYKAAINKVKKEENSDKTIFQLADAVDLPFSDGHFNRALCVETLEWIPQPNQALLEIRRVIKAGGCAVIIHSDFDSQIFKTDDEKLSRLVIRKFSDAGPNGIIGRDLYNLCVKAGFSKVEPMVYKLESTEWTPIAYPYRIAHMMVDWLENMKLVSKGKLQQWIGDLEKQHSKGNFYYSINRHICLCRK